MTFLSELHPALLVFARESPSKLDREVLLAIGDRDVDAQKYPSVHKWRNMLQSFSDSEMQRWVLMAGDSRWWMGVAGETSLVILLVGGSLQPAVSVFP